LGLIDSRNGCALQGALDTIRAIRGFVPIVHSTPGCTVYAGTGRGMTGGRDVLTGKGGVSLCGIPASNIIERQVIFGGGSRLREQINTTVKVFRGDAYVVLSGCATEIIGDDIPYMASESRDYGYPTIDIPTAGFRGNAYSGYAAAVSGVARQLSFFGEEGEEKEETAVNLLGLPPVLNAYWAGSLRTLTRLLENLGVHVNRLFGPESSLSEWKRFPKADMNIVFSPWGLEAARFAEQEFGTKFTEWDGVPLGPQTADFLNHAATLLGIPETRVRRAADRGEQSLDDALSAITHAYYRYGFDRSFVIVGDTTLVLPVLAFLEDTLGLPADGAVITDSPDEEAREHISRSLKRRGITPLFTEDTAEVAGYISEASPELILGSLYERPVAEKLGIPLFEMSPPILQRIILGRPLAGYEGAVSLAEDLFSLIQSHSEGTV